VFFCFPFFIAFPLLFGLFITRHNTAGRGKTADVVARDPQGHEREAPGSPDSFFCCLHKAGQRGGKPIQKGYAARTTREQVSAREKKQRMARVGHVVTVQGMVGTTQWVFCLGWVASSR
jgi:hypothetical protein